MIPSWLLPGSPVSAATLVWLPATLLVWAASRGLARRCGGHPLANPVLVTILVIGAALVATGTPHARFFGGVRILHLLLGPATVALAVPLVRHLGLVRASLCGVLLAITAGAAAAALGGIALVAGAGGSRTVALSMLPKAVTTPIAMAVAGRIGGVPSLAAVFAILGGITAAVIMPAVLRLGGITDWRARGLAAGAAGSGIAAAQIAGQNPTAAAFAAVAIGVNGLVTAVIAPVIALLWPA